MKNLSSVLLALAAIPKHQTQSIAVDMLLASKKMPAAAQEVATFGVGIRNGLGKQEESLNAFLVQTSKDIKKNFKETAKTFKGIWNLNKEEAN